MAIASEQSHGSRVGAKCQCWEGKTHPWPPKHSRHRESGPKGWLPSTELAAAHDMLPNVSVRNIRAAPSPTTARADPSLLPSSKLVTTSSSGSVDVAIHHMSRCTRHTRTHPARKAVPFIADCTDRLSPSRLPGPQAGHGATRRYHDRYPLPLPPPTRTDAHCSFSLFVCCVGPAREGDTLDT